MDQMLTGIRRRLDESDDIRLLDMLVNAPFEHKVEMVTLGLGIIVFLLADKQDGLVHRIALSNTELAAGTKRISDMRFEDIKIPCDYAQNIIVEAINTGQPQMTTDWQYLFAPALTAQQARFNQAGGGIECSYVYPLRFAGEDGAFIFSFFHYRNGSVANPGDFMSAYSHMAAQRLGREGTAASIFTTVRSRR